MYICDECKCTFDTYKTIFESHGFEYGPEEEFYVSPCCEAGFFSAEKCAVCDEYTAEADLECGVCESCRDKLIAELNRLITESFTPAESQLLREYFDMEVGV